MDGKTLSTAICIMGPTASGKTALALMLARRLPVELISVDASQVYRGLDIGTAKPTAAEQAEVPHRLIDIRDPAESYSAADFRTDALREMADIVQRGRVPLLVGGTMFYFRALEFGLSALPSADPALRARLRKEADERGLAALHERLKAADPQAAARIHANDPQRLFRALEILEITGHGPTEASRQHPPEPAPYKFVKFAILPKDREALHKRIHDRFMAMLENGLLDEVKTLFKRGDLHPDLPSIRTVGYRQAWEYLAGTVGYSDMIEKAIAATRQLAKRQMTWLKSYPGLSAMDMAREPDIGKCLEIARLDKRLSEQLGLYS